MIPIIKFTESKLENFFIKYNNYFLLIIFAIVFFLRFRLLDVPLERDEGEYSYMGQLILEGIPPYKFAANMKLPGTYFVYAMIQKIFGQTIRGIHIGFLLISILNISLLFIFLKKHFSSILAFFTTLFFGIYLTSPYILGFAFHATHLVLLFFLFGLNIYFKAIINHSNKLFLLSGILFGFSFLMKQQAIFLLIFVGLYLIIDFMINKNKIKNLIVNELFLILGTILPFLFVIFYLIYNEVFRDFWFWTFSYASKYVGITTISEGLQNLKNTVFILSYGYRFFWFSAILGVFILFLTDLKIQKKIFLITLTIFSFFTTIPGLYFREHYFVPFIPSLIILSGITFTSIFIYFENKVNFKIIVFLFFAVCIILFRNSLNTFKSYYFSYTPNQISRFVYSANPFNEMIPISNFIKENSNPEDKIFVFGSEPEVYFYTNRKSASSYIYMYPLMEKHEYALEMQKKLIEENIPDKTKFFVIINPKLVYSWGLTKESNLTLIDYLEKIKSNKVYSRIGICEIISIEKTECNFNDKAKSYLTVGDYYVEVYKKINL